MKQVAILIYDGESRKIVTRALRSARIEPRDYEYLSVAAMRRDTGAADTARFLINFRSHEDRLRFHESLKTETGGNYAGIEMYDEN